MVDAFDPIQTQLALATQQEQAEQWESAYLNYKQVASKCLSQIANAGNSDQRSMLKEMADRAILQAQWCKQMFEDQKQSMRGKIQRQDSRADTKLGLAFLGPNFMQAFEFYQGLAEKYWKLATSNSQYKPAIGAAKLCYIFAAENALQIMRLYKDEDNETRQSLQKKCEENFKLAKFIKEKMDGDVSCDHRQQFLKNYSPAERLIIEKSQTVRSRQLDLWSFSSGIVK